MDFGVDLMFLVTKLEEIQYVSNDMKPQEIDREK